MKKSGFTAFWLTIFLSTAHLITGQGHSDIIEICTAPGDQSYVQVAYDLNHDEYLMVWEDNRNGNNNCDIYGQFIDGDGTLIGDNFAICTAEGHQYWPRLVFDPMYNRYFVVFEDWRNGPDNGDIRGVFVDSDGDFVDASTSDDDHTFGICTHEYAIYTCAVAINYKQGYYLVVWGDFRNDPEGTSHIGEDVYGQIVQTDGMLAYPQDPTVNFPIANSEQIDESVADVTYNPVTDEFFVVFGNSMGYVVGQRVTHTGQLLNPDGSAAAKNMAVESMLPGLPVSLQFHNGPDCLQARVTSRTERISVSAKPMAQAGTEVLVVWKGMYEDAADNDVWGHRIGFIQEDDKYVAAYVDLDGDLTENVAQFPISIQENAVNAPELAYGLQDDEFMVGWGDPRTYGWGGQDLYTQRLDVNGSDEMIFLADDRVNTVTHTENNPVHATSDYEGGLMGVAHGVARNEFLIGYTCAAAGSQTGADIYARRFYGTPSTDVSGDLQAALPNRFLLGQNHPNPFNSATVIPFQVKETCHVRITLFSVRGREIATLEDRTYQPGFHEIAFNGSGLTTGIYFYRIETPYYSASRKMLIIE